MARNGRYCPIHGDRLICPTCTGKKGGQKTAKLHKNKLSEWGKRGGRPKKKNGRRKK